MCTQRSVRLSFCVTLVLGLGGCDDSKPKSDGPSNEEAASKADGQEDAAKEDTDPDALSDEAKYAKDLRKEGCKLLTPAMVADTFDVPEAQLEQMKMMGCIYTWEKDDEILEARISSIRVSDSEKKAARWFHNATKGMSAGDVDAAMKQIQERAREKGELDSNAKKKAAGEMGKAIGNMAGPGGFQFEDVDGVGDEARVSLNDGAVWVRVDNLQFNVAAYKGEKMPEPELAGNDLKQVAKVMQAANKAWMKDTLDQRKAASKKLAEVVLENL